MARQSVFDMPFAKVYACLVAKAEKKGRTKAEVDAVISWLTGYGTVHQEMPYGNFLSDAPAWNPRADRITGTVCGVRVEIIEDSLTKKSGSLTS